MMKILILFAALDIALFVLVTALATQRAIRCVFRRLRAIVVAT